jgi:hypothetical protein
VQGGLAMKIMQGIAVIVLAGVLLLLLVRLVSNTL